MTALTESSVDIPLATLNQTPAPHAGPLGRLERIKNMLVEHYTPTDGGPARLKAKPRGAFIALSNVTRDPNTGNTSSVGWDNPELFAALGSQPLSICNAVPRVFDGNESVAYDDKRVVTNKLDESVMHTSDRILEAQDYAVTGGVRCSVWAEEINHETQAVVLFVGFRSQDDDAWICPPRILYAPTETDPTYAMARVVADTGGQFFWVVNNFLTGGNKKITVSLFNLHGQLIDTDSSLTQVWETEPGYWDVSKVAAGGLLFAQPLHNAIDATDGVQFAYYTQTAGSINAPTVKNRTEMHCRGPVAFVTNKLDNGFYLATVGLSEAPSGRLWGYQILTPTPNAISHEYNFATLIPGETYPDSLIGYTRLNTDPDSGNVLDMIVSFTVLATTQTVGPKFDPALRFSMVYSCDFSDTVVFIRQNNSTCQVSRAFEHDGEYYAITYYQSGSGLTVTQSSHTVDWTDGDYMIGQQEQPVNILLGGDATQGSAKTLTSVTGIYTSTALAPQNIDGAGTPDSVAQFVAIGIPGITDGSVLLRWTLKNLTDASLTPGGRLKINGSSIASANTQWTLLYNESSHVFITLSRSIINSSVLPGNFTTTGTAEVVSMTTYTIDSIDTVYDRETEFFLPTGTMQVSGAPFGGNNGTFTIAEANVIQGSGFIVFAKGIRVVTTTQNSSLGPFTAILTPFLVQDWLFGSETFDDSLLVGPHQLVVAGSAHPDNDGTYQITAAADAIITTDGDNITAEVFHSPLPTITVRVPDDVSTFTFKLQSLTLDYTFYGALVFVQDARNSANNGIYQISFIDFVNGTFVAAPADGRTGQRSELFANDISITIFFQNAIQPVFQPKWFIEPLFDCQTAHIGRFEDGIAFADWRLEGQPITGPSIFPLHVTSVIDVTDGKEFVLPYRARSFTAGQPLVAPPNQVAEASVTIFESTVGLKRFSLKSECGFAAALSNELLVPGPLSSVFTTSGFREQGISVAPEAPFIVSESTETDDLHLTPGTTHQIVVTYEVTDENGNRVYCPPSPPVSFVLSGTNNSVVYGGRLPLPFDTDGASVPKHFGVTNHKLIGITISRTSYRGGLPTVQHFKITQDLNVNGLAPVSDLNPSGFSFPDEFTWNYKDQNPDVNILSSEILYTDKAYLPRFPASAARWSTVWQNRPWIAAYDGSLQFGGEFAEGDAPWFFPGFRYTFGNDKAVSCAPMGNYLIVGCENSIWYIPQPNAFPDASGRNGSLPTPIQLDKIKSGCTGIMLPVDGGVAYTSTVGGVWLITTNFQNVYMSRDIQDQLPASVPVTAMQIDGNNRLHVATGTNQLFTYDQIVGTWYNWELPSDGSLLAMVDGQITYQSDSELVRYYTDSVVDFAEAIPVPILWRIKFANFSFGGVRRFKHCWAFQILGEYLGPHRLWAVISYPDDKYEPNSVRGPLIPNGIEEYLAEFNPSLEDASTFSVEIYNDFEDVLEPGESASIECLSAAVGLESGMAQTTRRLT